MRRLLVALRYYKCDLCGHIRETLRNKIPKCNHNQCEEGIPIPLKEMKEVIKSPSGKFMIPANKATGRSKLKDMDKTLKERARNHSRDTLLDDNIQLNKDNKFGVSQNFLNEKGEKRRKIDDI